MVVRAQVPEVEEMGKAGKVMIRARAPRLEELGELREVEEVMSRASFPGQEESGEVWEVVLSMRVPELEEAEVVVEAGKVGEWDLGAESPSRSSLESESNKKSRRKT